MAQSAAPAQDAVLSTPQRAALARIQSDFAILCQGGIDFDGACEMIRGPPPSEPQLAASAAGNDNGDSSNSESVSSERGDHQQGRAQAGVSTGSKRQRTAASAASAAPNPLRRLNLESIVNVMAHLGQHDRAMIARCSKALLDVSRDPQLWHTVDFLNCGKCLPGAGGINVLRHLRDPSKVRELLLPWHLALGAVYRLDAYGILTLSKFGTENFAAPLKGLCPNVETLVIGKRGESLAPVLRGSGHQDMERLGDFSKTLVASLPSLKRLALHSGESRFHNLRREVALGPRRLRNMRDQQEFLGFL